MTPEEQSWLAEVEERVNRALSTIQPEPFWKDFTRLLALVKRLVDHSMNLAADLKMSEHLHQTFKKANHDTAAERDTLRSQLEVAKEALKRVASAYYETSGGLAAWKRDVLETVIESDTAIARAALAAIEERK